MWGSDDNDIVSLTEPSVTECEYVIRTLAKENQTGIEWSICLNSSSPESTEVIISNLNKCVVWNLDMRYTPLNNMCVSTLSEALKINKTMKKLEVFSCPLIGGIKQFSDVLFTNTTLEDLVLDNITGFTDEDIFHLSNMIASNTTLKVLRFRYCNITDHGVQYICEGLTKNQTLTVLDIAGNHQITSVSTSTITDLIQMNTSLTELVLFGTSLDDDDIKTICTSLTKNTRIQKLHLSRRHEENFKNLDSYEVILDRLEFLY